MVTRVQQDHVPKAEYQSLRKEHDKALEEVASLQDTLKSTQTQLSTLTVRTFVMPASYS